MRFAELVEVERVSTYSGDTKRLARGGIGAKNENSEREDEMSSKFRDKKERKKRDAIDWMSADGCGGFGSL